MVVVSVKSGRYEYQKQVVFVAGDIVGLDFYPSGYKQR
jgi:hypothetical protein